MSDTLDSMTTPSPAEETKLLAGRYVMVRPIAEGGTAVVHLGWDSWEHEWRAVKTLLPEYSSRASLRHRFEVEARTMSMLDHDAIVKVYDAGIDGDTAYMVMEFAEGGSVVDWVERYGPMPPRMAVEVALALCAGVGAAHDQGIIHRDVKPQNLLIASDGTCKVTDFGIAQVVEDTRVTMTGTVMGTIGYMAPEQHESAKHTDERADIYSVAATLFTVAKGEAATHLFMADDKDFEGLPAELAEVIRKGAQYRREARYQTIREMTAALKSVLEGLPEDPPGTPELLAARPLNLSDVPPPTQRTETPAPSRSEPEAPRPDDDAAPSIGSLEPPPPPAKASPRDVSTSDSGSVRRTQVTASGRFRVAQPYGYALEQAAQRRERLVMAAVLAVALSVVAGSTFILEQHGATMIHNAQSDAQELRVKLYDVLLDEWGVTRELEGLDIDASEIEEVESLFEVINDNRDDNTRFAAAVRLHNQLQQHRRQARQSPGNRVHIVRSLDARLERIDGAMERERMARETVERHRDTLPGRVATFFGN